MDDGRRTKDDGRRTENGERRAKDGGTLFAGRVWEKVLIQKISDY